MADFEERLGSVSLHGATLVGELRRVQNLGYSDLNKGEGEYSGDLGMLCWMAEARWMAVFDVVVKVAFLIAVEGMEIGLSFR